jgi:hypothetical protein
MMPVKLLLSYWAPARAWSQLLGVLVVEPVQLSKLLPTEMMAPLALALKRELKATALAAWAAGGAINTRAETRAKADKPATNPLNRVDFMNLMATS